MASSYTSLLGLVLPVQGELQGTWGDTVNNELTSLLDTAIAGTTTLSSDADVTLTDTDGTANQARQQIILWTASGTVTRNITAPAQSKTYVVINATGSTQSIVIRGVGPTTGVTLLAGEKALVAWNGSDFVKVSTFGGDATLNSLTLSGGTANGVTYLNGSKVLTSGSALTFDGDALTLGSATAPRLKANMSGTQSTRFAIQSSVTNGNSRFYIYPNGTGTISAINGWNNSDPNAVDYQAFDLAVIGTTDVRLSSQASGAAAFLPLTFYTNGSEQMRLTSTGLGIGTSSPGAKLDVSGVIRSNVGLRCVTASGTQSELVVQQTGFAAWSIYNPASGTDLRWYNGTDKMILDASGNLGLGVTPSASWSAGFKAFQIAGQGAGVSASTSTSNVYFSSNGVYNGSNWLYYNSASAGQYQIDGNAHKWYSAASGTSGNAISFTQAMTLDASGNLGVGTSSPTSGFRLDVQAAFARQRIESTTGTNGVQQRFVNTGGTLYTGIDESSGAGFGAAYAAVLWHSGNYPMLFGTNNAERARITSGGDFDIGTQAGTGTRTLTVQTNTSGDPTLTLTAAGADSGSFWFERANVRLYARASNTGGVYLASGGTAWTAVSDERLKTALTPIENAATKVSSLRAVTGRYKTDANDVSRSFLIAQDVQAVFPEAVNADNPDELGLSYTDMVPLLVAAIKEQQALINDLRARVAALESQP